MEMFDWRERVEEAKHDKQNRNVMKLEVEDQLEQVRRSFGQIIRAESQVEETFAVVTRMKYFTKMLEELRAADED